MRKRLNQEVSRIMDRHPSHRPQQHRVTALFGDHEQSFDLETGTTFAQLAELLADLARQNHGWPKGVSVVFENAPNVAHTDMSTRPHGTGQIGTFR